jgi:hypothetical protein
MASDIVRMVYYTLMNSDNVGTIRSTCGMSTFQCPVDVLQLLCRAWKVAPALAVGCTIVMKPSELTPLTALVGSLLIGDCS